MENSQANKPLEHLVQPFRFQENAAHRLLISAVRYAITREEEEPVWS